MHANKNIAHLLLQCICPIDQAIHLINFPHFSSIMHGGCIFFKLGAYSFQMVGSIYCVCFLKSFTLLFKYIDSTFPKNLIK